MIQKNINLIDSFNKDKFNAYILVNEEHSYKIKTFNDCNLHKEPLLILNKFDKKYYNAFKVDIDCVKSQNNYLKVSKNEMNSFFDAKLYITNN